MNVINDLRLKLGCGWRYEEFRIYAEQKFTSELSSSDFLARVGQDYFRTELLLRFNNKCLITKKTIPLRACHIVPYSITKDCLDTDNGLLLTCDMHDLYDNFYFTIHPNTKEVIVVENCDELKKYKGIILQDLFKYPSMNKYLEYHYNQFIKKMKSTVHNLHVK